MEGGGEGSESEDGMEGGWGKKGENERWKLKGYFFYFFFIFYFFIFFMFLGNGRRHRLLRTLNQRVLKGRKAKQRTLFCQKKSEDP